MLQIHHYLPVASDIKKQNKHEAKSTLHSGDRGKLLEDKHFSENS